MFSADLRRLWSPDWIPILLAQAFGVTCGLVGVRLISTWVPPTELGLYGLCLALVPAGAQLTHHGLARHAARFWPLSESAYEYYQATATAARQASVILLGVLTLSLAGVAAFTEVAFVACLPWLLIAGLSAAYGAISHAVIQAVRAYWTDCALTCTYSLLRTGGPLLGIVIAGSTAPILLAGFALPQSLLALFGWYFVIGRLARAQPAVSSSATAPTSAELNRYSTSFWLVGACTLAAGALHRGWAAVCLDATELGFFTLAGNLAFVLPNIASSALTQFVAPRLFAAARESSGAGARTWLAPVERTATVFLLAAMGGTLLLFLAGPSLLGVLIHPRYEGALPYLFANGAYATALALGHLYQLPALASGRANEARRTMVGLTAVLVIGGGVSALASSRAYLIWLSASPFVSIIWLAWSVRRHAHA